MTHKGIRLYGVTGTNGSFGRVAAGIREGLEDLGALAGVVPIDDIEDDGVYHGALAPTAVFTGPPSLVPVMASHGEHTRHYAVLAPNSEWLPERLMESMTEYTSVVAPSTWGAKVVERYTGEWIEPYRHGVSKKFIMRPATHLRGLYDDGHFRVLHLSSTDRARKGTNELITAWLQLVRAGRLGRAPQLHLVVDTPPGTFPEAEASDSIRFPWRHLNGTVDQMCALYQQFHLVCQPSRGEGFGMVPLEARASGVPVCATACTGHADHVIPGSPGIVVVPHGPAAPIDDAPHPEALAPSIPVDGLVAALSECYERWTELVGEAQAEAEHVRQLWSWRSVTEHWLRKAEIEWT